MSAENEIGPAVAAWEVKKVIASDEEQKNGTENEKQKNTTEKEEEENLYDPSLLAGLDISVTGAEFSPAVTVCNPGDGLLVRPLQLGDRDRGYLQLLQQLTTVGEVGAGQWETRFRGLQQRRHTYYITVLEDQLTGQIVGTVSLVVEQKFIHSCGQVGRVEDVVVSSDHRGRQLGKFLVALAVALAANLHCYKVTLNCKDNMVKFYGGLGFRCEPGDANFLVIRLPNNNSTSTSETL